jgi:hypothetical protein
MAAQGRRAALQDGIHRRPLLRGAVGDLKIVGEVFGEDIRQLQHRFDCGVKRKFHAPFCGGAQGRAAPPYRN